MSFDKSAQRIEQMFGEIADRYDFLNHLLSLGIDRIWRRKMTRLVAPEDGAGPILDVCTGTAELALAYWQAGRRKGATDVAGTDFCQPMLALGRKKTLQTEAWKRVKLIAADTLHLPFADETFQIVCVAFGLRNLSDLDAGLREMVRVCRPGGRVAVLEFSLPQTWPWKTLYKYYFQYVLPFIGQSLARNSQKAYNYLPASVGCFPQGADLAQRMAAAGLSTVKYYPFTFGIATLYVGWKG